ncbi:hypothetical protein OB959_13080 [Aeromonas bestiarum]|uniref:Phage integrase n=1 Tax=Aeromonas bestiarum TaxID=105751 RepID=A0AAW7HYX2_9GAMM|nr:hypothetical protein [Aeromonas bestiarum]MDM5140726.1 hypothetical protein [Aeromonas bestiarum]
MGIKSTPEGYLVDIRPLGREGKRIRKCFKTKSEAQQFERWILPPSTIKSGLIARQITGCFLSLSNSGGVTTARP